MIFATDVLAPFLRQRTLDNTYRYGGGIVSILASSKDTNGVFGLIETIQVPGAEPPLHVHDDADETFYILDGRVAVMVSGEVHQLKAGDTIFLPRGIPHTFRIKSPSARALVFITPAGFEEWFRTLGEPARDFELPDHVFPPTQEQLNRMIVLSQRLKLYVVDENVSF
jgi:quercetin dioxygenase-like cupin family protein